jgi:hypothetical protein
MGSVRCVIKHPRVGSGKIKRRVRISLENKFLNRGRVLRQPNEKQDTIIDSKITFPNTSIKIIFEFWNRQGFPFIFHKKKKTKVTSRIFSLLKPICNKYEQREIINAIECGYRLFNNKSFVFHFAYNKYKIAFPTFLSHSSAEQGSYESWATMKWVKKKLGVALPNSWFKECLKGWEYLEKTYCVKDKAAEDKHPELTEQAIRMMNNHRCREINDKGKQDLIKFSKMVINWGRLNKIDPYWLADHIETALNDYKTMRIDKAYYLTTEIFWTETLPNELVRYDRLNYEGRNFVYDKKEMLK